ncbi:hypothetical protein C7M84_022867 [Penaeus vannamei]|uniref:DUF7042 domain-containing protein n=1 Tax=Penaeus vannamei TaxID=6689 RepID=A0A3R7Q214_PENVA|nr:hypothetical protein C7M84_022867 [Penaeus vannamei]
MFRRDARPVPCQFKGPLTFGYQRGHGQCNSPASTIDSCTSESRLLFKYQACPDVQGTESSVQEVECIGHWKEGSTRYFVGRLEGRRADEDRYRCFAWREPGKPIAAWTTTWHSRGCHVQRRLLGARRLDDAQD